MESKELEVALYDGCQYYCTFCMYGYVKEKHPLSRKDRMSDEDWHSLFSLAYKRGYRYLSLAGRGEPTLHPSFNKIVTWAYQLGYRIQLLTNGLNDQAVIGVLPFIHKLKINLNSVNEQELDQIHKPAPGFPFERCTTSIRNILRTIAEKKYDIKLHTNYVVTRQSLNQAFTFPKNLHSLFSSQLGTTKIFISYLYFINYVKTATENLELDYEEMEKFLSSARAHSHDKFLIENTDLLKFIKHTEVLLKRLRPLSKNLSGKTKSCSGHQLYTCDAHALVSFVDGNGDCYGCYNPFRIVNGLPASEDPFFFGNLRTQSFEEIFERKGFNPVMDVSNKYWQPCLSCVAKGPMK